MLFARIIKVLWQVDEDLHTIKTDKMCKAIELVINEGARFTNGALVNTFDEIVPKLRLALDEFIISCNYNGDNKKFTLTDNIRSGWQFMFNYCEVNDGLIEINPSKGGNGWNVLKI